MAINAQIISDAAGTRRVAFLAPNLGYAQAVVRKMRKDLDKEGIEYDSYSGETKGEPYLNTNHIQVKFIYSDPVTWNNFTLSGYTMIFGKKELLRAAREKFLRANLPIGDTFVQRYIIEFENGDWSKTIDKPKATYLPEISKVHFNPPMTIVLWEDGTKTTVKCQEDDAYSDEVGLALCIAKKALGNKGNFNNVFSKWVPDCEIDIKPIMPDNPLTRLAATLFPTYPSTTTKLHHNNKEEDSLND